MADATQTTDTLAGWTPGPWKTSLDGAGPIERDPRVWVYATDGVNWPRIAVVEAVMRGGDLCGINAANSRLIAAAPAMAEALERLLNEPCPSRQYVNGHPAADAARAALRLAKEGR